MSPDGDIKLANSIIEIDSIWSEKLQEKELEFFILKHLHAISESSFSAIYHVVDQSFKLSICLGVEWTEQKKQLTLSINQGLIGQSYNTGQTIVCNDVMSNKHYYHIFQNVKSIALIPLHHDQKVTKIIALYKTEINSFTDNIVQACKAYTTYLSKLILLDSIDKNKKIKQKQLAEEETASTTFLSTVSHELRTPLHSTMGMLEIIEKTSPQNEIQEYANLAYKSADQLLFLVNDILDYAKVKSGKLTIQNEVISLTECIEETVTILAEQAHAKGIDLFYNSNQYPFYKVLGDKNRIRQILQNLIHNAIKFTDSGHVSFSIDQIFERDDTTQINFTVKDTGIGIAPQHLEHIFKPFTQAQLHTGDNQRKSSGLGLAITKDLVSEMNGNIYAKSTLGAGSAFYVSLHFTRASENDDTIYQPVVGSRALLATPRKIELENYRGIINTCKGTCYTAHNLESIENFITSLRSNKAQIDLAIIDETFIITKPSLLDQLHEHTQSASKIIITAKYSTRRNKLEAHCKFDNVSVFRSPLLPSVISKQLFESHLPKKSENHNQVEEGKTTYEFSNNLKVLVVDDIEVNRYILSIQLKKLSITPVLAQNGTDCLELLANEAFDCAFIDVRLPDYSAYEILTKLAKEPKYKKNHKLFTIGISANTRSEEKRANNPEYLFNDFLSKPIRFIELKETVQRFIKSQKDKLQTLINLE